ncbi:MAG: M56 family metallopeptidase [Gemmatimonadaceae bacterium]
MSTLRDVFSSSLAMSELGLIAKVTMLLALGLLTASAMRPASAAVRHFVWALVLSGSAALLVLSATAPRIPLRLSVPQAALGAASSLDERARLMEARKTLETVTLSDVAGRGGARKVPLTDATERDTHASNAEAVGHPASPPAAWLPRTRTAAGIALLLAGVWLLGTLLVLAKLVVGHLAVSRLTVTATTLVDAAFASALREARARIPVRRPVRLLMSADVTAPITAGVWHPMIFLPPDAAGWNDERLDIVLMHELAHIARYDYLAQVIASATCALFWFHPGVWLAARRLRAEGEQAADDRVLNAGAPSVTYATHLLEIARHGLAAHRSAAVTLGMVRGGASQFERRLRAMLDTTHSRAGVSSRQKWITAGFSLLALIPLAGIRTELVAAPAGREDRVLLQERTAATLTVTSESVPVGAVGESVKVTSTEHEALPMPNAMRTEGDHHGDSTFERTLRASPGEQIRLDLRSGGTVTIHAHDEPNVRLRATLDGTNWRETDVSFERITGGVRLEARQEQSRRESSTSHRFEVWVPRRFDVDIRSAGGGIAITDLEGEFVGHTGGGPIEIERTKGRSSLSTGGGNIRVTDSELRGTVSTGGGTVLLSNVRGGLRASSGSGPVIYADNPDAKDTIREGEEVASRRSSQSAGVTGSLDGLSIGADKIRVTDDVGRLHISKAGGRITLDRAPRGGTLHTGGGNIRVGGSSGLLSVNTGGGSIELREVAGDAKATTGAGDVTITIVNADGSEHSIEVRSGKGRVVLELPQTLSARFDLETAYTEGFGPTSIESDWKVDREETTDWDDSEGTPRKYVRARGTFGSGAGLIRVRTVNGDITVRRASR